MDPKVLADMIYNLRVLAMDAKQKRDSTNRTGETSELFAWRTGYYDGISAAIRAADNTLDEVLYTEQPKPKK